MASDFASDLESIFDTGELAVLASYIRRGYLAASIPVIFVAPRAPSNLPGGAEFENVAPEVRCRTSDTPYLAHGDRFMISGTIYSVVGSPVKDPVGKTSTATLSVDSDG